MRWLFNKLTDFICDVIMLFVFVFTAVSVLFLPVMLAMEVDAICLYFEIVSIVMFAVIRHWFCRYLDNK